MTITTEETPVGVLDNDSTEEEEMITVIEEDRRRNPMGIPDGVIELTKTGEGRPLGYYVTGMLLVLSGGMIHKKEL